MGTPASEYRKESSNFFELSLCVEFIFAKENLFKLCIDYADSLQVLIIHDIIFCRCADCTTYEIVVSLSSKNDMS